MKVGVEQKRDWNFVQESKFLFPSKDHQKYRHSSYNCQEKSRKNMSFLYICSESLAKETLIHLRHFKAQRTESSLRQGLWRNLHFCPFSPKSYSGKRIVSKTFLTKFEPTLILRALFKSGLKGSAMWHNWETSRGGIIGERVTAKFILRITEIWIHVGYYLNLNSYNG